MFTLGHLRALLEARPFVPFRLLRAEGEPVEVRSPQLILPGQHMAVIGLPEPGAREMDWDRFTFVAYSCITGVEMLNADVPQFIVPAR